MRQKPPLTVKFSSYGHYKVSTTYYGKEISCITTNMPAIDSFEDGNINSYSTLRNAAYTTLRNECIRKHKGNI